MKRKRKPRQHRAHVCPKCKKLSKCDNSLYGGYPCLAGFEQVCADCYEPPEERYYD